MSEQNFDNHKSIVVGYHYVSFFAILALIITSIVYLVQSLEENLLLSIILLINCISLFLVWYYTRVFAAKAQDRAIKVEENFRHYLMTGKPLGENLTILQIIGLRFASDEEFVELAERAEKDNLSQVEIKKSIKKWRPNTYRV